MKFANFRRCGASSASTRGTPDRVLGPKTRAAAPAFARAQNMKNAQGDPTLLVLNAVAELALALGNRKIDSRKAGFPSRAQNVPNIVESDDEPCTTRCIAGA